jgi:hypothetical protein
MLATLAALALAAAPAVAPTPTDTQCDALWDETVAAAAPDLEPTDELRRGFLLKEKAQLARRCSGAGLGVLTCAKQGAARCRAKADGGSVTGLARCVYPAVQECVQLERLKRAKAEGTLDKLLARVRTGELTAAKGVLKLPADANDLSLGGVALATTTGGDTDVVLLTFNERNTVLRGWLVSTRAARFDPKAAPAPVTVGGASFAILRVVDPTLAEVATPSK